MKSQELIDRLHRTIMYTQTYGPYEFTQGTNGGELVVGWKCNGMNAIGMNVYWDENQLGRTCVGMNIYGWTGLGRTVLIPINDQAVVEIGINTEMNSSKFGRKPIRL